MATTRRLAALLALLLATTRCDAADPAPATPAAARYTWIDAGSPPGDLEADSAACHQRIRRDPWAQRIDVFNRAVLVQGCMQKKGWEPARPAYGAARR